MPTLSDDANRRFDFAKALLARATVATLEEDWRSLAEGAVAFSFASLEGVLSEIFEHFTSNRVESDIFEQAIMNESAVKLQRGRPVLGRQQFQSIDDRLQYLFWKFSGSEFDTQSIWWPSFAQAVQLRNNIMHPKGPCSLELADAEQAVRAVLNAIDALMQVVFKKPWPKASKGLIPSTSI